jgi:hypothetical protein
MGFTIAINAWGVHTVLHRAMAAAELQRWDAEWRAAVESCGGRRSVGLVADLRGLTGADGEAVMAQVAPLLFAPLGRADVERCAVLVADAAQADRFGQIAGGLDPSRKVRVLVVEGRDRVQIAAAYGWALNGAEPTLAQRLPGGALVRLAKTARPRDHHAPLRRAS